jgi:hypothetical protein
VAERRSGVGGEPVELLRNPLTSKQIWIVLGNMLSAGGLYKQLASANPKPESLQLNHRLQTTIAAAASGRCQDPHLLCSLVFDVGEYIPGCQR